MKIQYLALFAGLPLLAACTNAQNCDPNQVSNVFMSAMCSSNGEFANRQSALSSELGSIQAEVAKQRSEINAAQRRIREIDAQTALTARQKTELANRMSALNASVDRLAITTPGSAEAARLQTQIDRQRAGIDNYLNISIF